MSFNASSSTHSRVISAFFDTQDAATSAVDDLIAAGTPKQNITQTSGQNVATTTDTYDEKGFWASLKDLFIPENDRHGYAEGLRRGGHLVSVRADEANYDRVLDILDREGSVNMDEREGQWRSDGWSGYTGEGLAASAASGLATAPGTGAAAHDADAVANDRYVAKTDSAALASASTPDANPRIAPLADTAVRADKDEVVPVYEEQMRIGKRDVNHGRVRLRSYVVETPVSEQVNLRQEKVSVDRQPVDRPIAATDAMFKERVIEVDERAEEAVVAKEVRVKEEISLRKTSEERVETIADSVRHTEVEVQDDRVGRGVATTPFKAETDGSRILEHMDVISSDGQTIGKVDHLDGPDKIKLTKNSSPDGQHHIVPFTWIDHVDQHVHLKKTLAEINAGI